MHPLSFLAINPNPSPNPNPNPSLQGARVLELSVITVSLAFSSCYR